LISFYSKVTLKKLSRQMVEAVQAESSIGSLRTTLEVRGVAENCSSPKFLRF
jgi:hypothetical protein